MGGRGGGWRLSRAEIEHILAARDKGTNRLVVKLE
jgi:hypothetical protein